MKTVTLSNKVRWVEGHSGRRVKIEFPEEPDSNKSYVPVLMQATSDAAVYRLEEDDEDID